MGITRNFYRCDFTDKVFDELLDVLVDIGKLHDGTKKKDVTQINYNTHSTIAWYSNCGTGECKNEALCMKKVRICDIKKIKGEL